MVNILPYDLRVGEDGYYVVNTDTKKRKNKYGMSKSKAKKYMKALYANKDPSKYERKPYRKGNWRSVLRKTFAKIL